MRERVVGADEEDAGAGVDEAAGSGLSCMTVQRSGLSITVRGWACALMIDTGHCLDTSRLGAQRTCRGGGKRAAMSSGPALLGHAFIQNRRRCCERGAGASGPPSQLWVLPILEHDNTISFTFETKTRA